MVIKEIKKEQHSLPSELNPGDIHLPSMYELLPAADLFIVHGSTCLQRSIVKRYLHGSVAAVYKSNATSLSVRFGSTLELPLVYA
jgi:hypothetical protein